jgi:hypothetical protein
MTGADAIHHGSACQGPPSAHDSAAAGMAYEDALFLCKDHLMTAMKAGGYGMIYITPPALLDWTSGEAVLSFDTSTLNTSSRDWQDIWITPYAQNLALPLGNSWPDVHGGPPTRIHIHGANEKWYTEIWKDGANTNQGGNSSLLNWSEILTPDAARRTKLEIRISSNHIRVMAVDNATGTGCVKVGLDGLFNTADDVNTHCIRPSGQPAKWIDANITTPLTWTQGVVQIGHHSYNPHKDCAAGAVCVADTWHWDNVSLTPYQPFQIIRGAPRFVQAPAQDITFPQPAPPNSYLRFGAVGRVELSTDGGATWAVQPFQPATKNTTGSAEAFSYFVPIPAGTQSVKIRLSAHTIAGLTGYQGPFIAQDFAIFSMEQAIPPTATPTQTPAPNATETPTMPPTPTDMPATETPTPAPTDTPTPMPTDTPIPTNTAVPTATPSGDACVVRVFRGGVAVAEWECR